MTIMSSELQDRPSVAPPTQAEPHKVRDRGPAWPPAV